MISFVRLQLSPAQGAAPRVDINGQCFEEWRSHAGSNLAQTVSGSSSNYRLIQQAQGTQTTAPWSNSPIISQVGVLGRVLYYINRYMGPFGSDHLIHTSEDFNLFRSALRDFFAIPAISGSMYSTLQQNTQRVMTGMSASAFCVAHPDYFCCINAANLAERIQAASSEARTTPLAVTAAAQVTQISAGDAGTAATPDAVVITPDTSAINVAGGLLARNPALIPVIDVGGTGSVGPELGARGQLQAGAAGAVSLQGGDSTSLVINQVLTTSNAHLNTQRAVGDYLSRIIGSRIRDDASFQASRQSGFRVTVSIEYSEEISARISRVEYNRRQNPILDSVVRAAFNNLQAPHFTEQSFPPPQTWNFTVVIN